MNHTLEVDLLLCLCRTPPSPESKDQAQSLLKQGIDWDTFLTLADLHALMSFVGWRFREIGFEAVPDTVREQFRTRVFVSTARQMLLSTDLTQVLELFRSKQIEALAFKGPVLTVALYGDVSLREYSDLDLLVQPADVPRVKPLLEGMEYRTEVDTEHPETAPVTRFNKELLFERDEGRAIDLHWGLKADLFSSPLELGSVWERSASVALNGTPIPTLCPDDLFLYLCFHGGKHLWSRLSWLVDLARLVEVKKSLDWEWIHSQASTRGCERMVLLAEHLSGTLLGAHIPAERLERARRDEAVRSLAREVERRLPAVGDAKPGVKVGGQFLTQLLERRSDRLRYMIGVTLAPQPADWREVRFPRPLFFLYYPFRPVRLVAKYLKQVVMR